ncbi:Uncharacterized protein EJ110_NYTH55473 [Nymphaea thermarum]|nr:Uncharacterized protein EJ110_NYTH55473 [Nymphaea thermarum]
MKDMHVNLWKISFSGTNAISYALFSVLRPGNEVSKINKLSCTFYLEWGQLKHAVEEFLSGAPYDTFEKVIGISISGLGCLKELGILYRLAEDGGLDCDTLCVSLKPQTRCAFVQRSCRYTWHRCLILKQQNTIS